MSISFWGFCGVLAGSGSFTTEAILPEAKSRLFAERVRWLFDNQEERDGAPPPPLTTSS